jgi:ABC-type uncharacterized transport system involved in gliding motility auxiliary subunit
MALMKNDYRRYAPIGLIISLLAILTGIGALIAKALAFAGLYFPSNPELLNQLGLGALTGFILGLAIYAILDPERARIFLTGRQAQYGSNAVIMLLAFIGIVITVNVIAFQNPKQWDVTEDQSNTLADETITTLQSLPDTVTAMAFYSGNLNPASATQLMDRFKAESGGKFDYQIIDPLNNPVAAQEAGITSDGQIVLVMGTERETISYASEQELTNGLIRLMNPRQPVIYFVTGHGERDTETSGETGFTQVRLALEGRNYIVKTLNLPAEKQIPADAEIVIVAGPQVPLAQAEVDLLKDFQLNGGALIVMEDPLIVTQFGETADPLADYLSNTWGITLNNDLIINPNAPTNPTLADVGEYASHPITNRMNKINTIFPVARSLTLDPTINPAAAPLALVTTFEQAWGERDMKSINDNQISFDPNSDLAGPVTVVAAAQDSATGARLVVFGNSAFALDPNLSAAGNSSFITNTVDWAAGEESLISLSSKQSIDRQFKQPGVLQLISSVLLAVCVLPLIVIGAGVASWLTRRRRG